MLKGIMIIPFEQDLGAKKSEYNASIMQDVPVPNAIFFWIKDSVSLTADHEGLSSTEI
jgi:hypothetical protein